jgi:GWxTD domain-containing protein
MKRTVSFLALVLVAGALGAQSIPELFAKVKEQVKAESWADALVTLEVIDVEAAKPANEKYRSQLEAPSAFYRGVCEANLGDAQKASADFETFLRLQPNASIDEKIYSKKAVAAFGAAQKSVASAGPSIARLYAEFQPAGDIREPASPTWGDGPVQWLMTDSEKAAWAAATTDAERAAFVDKFWLARDAEDNHSFRPTFEKRVAFADANLKQGEKRGSMTDRGMVFVLLGPPTYGGRRRLKNGEDGTHDGGTSSVGALDSYAAQKTAQSNAYNNSQKAVNPTGSGKVTTSAMATMNDSFTGPNTQAADADKNYQEVWHYRRELLPKGVSYIQVDAVFVTKKGYGSNVLQRESDILTTLSAAKAKPE